MKKIVHYTGLDVHKETIAVAIAPQDTAEVRCYGVIGGTLDALDKLVKKLSTQNIELRFIYEAGPCGFIIHRYLKSKGIQCDDCCFCQPINPLLNVRKKTVNDRKPNRTARLTIREPYQRMNLSDGG
jgi:transposase